MSYRPRGGATRRHSGWWLVVAVVPCVVALGIMVWLAKPWQGGLDTDGPLMVTAGILLDVWAVLPYIVLGLVMWFLRLPHPVPWWLVTGYGAVMGAFGIWAYIDIVRSDSSTAVVGFVFLPVAQLAGLVLVLLAGLVVNLVGSRHRGPVDRGAAHLP